MVELWWKDITAKVLMMSSCSSLQEEDHLKLLFYMLWYIDSEHNALQVFEPMDFPKYYRTNTVCAYSSRIQAAVRIK